MIIMWNTVSCSVFTSFPVKLYVSMSFLSAFSSVSFIFHYKQTNRQIDRQWPRGSRPNSYGNRVLSCLALLHILFIRIRYIDVWYMSLYFRQTLGSTNENEHSIRTWTWDMCCHCLLFNLHCQTNFRIPISSS